nr:RNA-binding motif protein, Y chromosome, family 1 member B isoform X2 [Ipomoea batatas]
MALFCSPCTSPICSSQVRKPLAIGSLSVSKSLNLYTSNPKFSRNSFFSPPVTKSSLRNPQLCLSSTSSLDPEDNASSNTIIFIKGLPKSTSEESLKAAFSKFGDVLRVKILLDKKTKQPLSFANVWFSNEESAVSAADEMDGKFFNGRFIHVNVAKPGSCKSRAKTPPYKF